MPARRAVLSGLSGLVAACLLGGSCSSGRSSTSGPSVPLTAATFATVAPAATAVTGAGPSATTTRPPSTTAAIAASTSTSSSTSTSTSSPVTTSAPTSLAPTSLAPTSLAPPPPAPSGYQAVDGPAVGDATTALDPAWVGPDGTLSGIADGTYWATLAGQGESPQRFVSFRLTQAYFGSACTARFGPESCDNDIATVEAPTGTFPLYLGTARITVADAVSQQSYQITGDELFGLVGGSGPSAAAPAGFTFVPFAFLLTIAGGQIVSAEQVWTP